ncbi:hypothetical protein N9K42_00965 [Gammaproteobacteria bacterium]|nr:hypothetical protein [Gammaproteobacteria bacterium]
MLSKKLKILITCILIFLVGLNGFFLIMFVDGGTRYNGIRFVAESQNLIFEKRLEGAIKQRNFNQVVSTLASRFEYLKDLSPGVNSLSQDYIHNVQSSFVQAITHQEKALFIQLLEDLSKVYPSSFLVKLMLAESYGIRDSSSAYAAIDEALSLLGSASETYRLGIWLALLEKNSIKLQKYCKQLQENQHGGKQFADMNANQMQELGLRRIGLKLTNGSESIFLENNGLQIKSRIKYPFSLPESIIINNSSIRIFLPVLPGLRISMDSIHFYANGLEILNLPKESFVLASRENYFLSNGAIISSNLNRPHVLDLMLPKELEIIQSDKIELTLSFDRQNMFSQDVCSKDFQGL